MKNIVFIGAVCVAAVGLFAALSYTVTQDGVEVSVRSAEACTKSGPAECLPDLTYFSTDGTVWTRESLAGKIVMVNFWATWCKPCKAEIPALNASYDRHAKDGFILLGVMTDSQQVGPDELARFTERYPLEYPIVPADSEIMLAFDYPSSIPTTFVYDRIGNLRVRHPGQITESQLEDILTELLTEPDQES